MSGSTFGKPCAAHNCLKPHFKEGWCAAHWYAHQTRIDLQIEPDDTVMLDDLHHGLGDAPMAFDRPHHGSADNSIAICEAIWDAS